VARNDADLSAERDSDHDDHRQYSVFMTNCGSGHLTEYGYRWEIESGYKSIKRFTAATTSKNFGLRFFLLAFACLLYSIWRAVDLLVQVELTGEYEHSPIVTADNTLTLLKKKTESDSNKTHPVVERRLSGYAAGSRRKSRI